MAPYRRDPARHRENVRASAVSKGQESRRPGESLSRSPSGGRHNGHYQTLNRFYAQVRWTRNGIWFLDATGIDEPAVEDRPVDPGTEREQALATLQSSGRFTAIELAALRSLIVDRLTIAEIAERHGCTRQAVIARLVGNSRGQGGIVKKAQALLRR